ncbi:MAG: cytochrome C oxidase subunit IV family protein [Chloroflexaceae bacterium]|jgi:cytochrome c oxidase subunit 4|nr:cytochrome C oxidase subunit IV family protein [Chloroflexaceae bacterium]
MEHHIIPLRTYFTIFGALLLLLGLTVGVAFLDLGPFSVVVALSIAFAKAILIVLFFMHVRYSSRLVQIFAATALLWFFFMISLTIADYMARSGDWPPSPDSGPLSLAEERRLW